MKTSPHGFSLRQLQYAVAVAEHRSFRAAAEACLVSQPALSIQVARLEEALGVRLFERDRRRVLVTGAGEEVLARARTLLRQADDLEEGARRGADPLAGSLRLGVIPTVAPYLLPRLRPVLRRDFPALSPRWVEGPTAALVEELEAGRLDGAVLALEAELGDVEFAEVGRDPFVLAAPPGHPLARRRSRVRLSDLATAEVLLLDDGHCLRDQALAVCTTTRARELEYRATSLSTLVQMVADGAGVTLLPKLAVPLEAERADLVLREFADPAPGRTLAVIWRRGSPLGPSLRQVAASLRGVLAA